MLKLLKCFFILLWSSCVSVVNELWDVSVWSKLVKTCRMTSDLWPSDPGEAAAADDLSCWGEHETQRSLVSPPVRPQQEAVSSSSSHQSPCWCLKASRRPAGTDVDSAARLDPAASPEPAETRSAPGSHPGPIQAASERSSNNNNNNRFHFFFLIRSRNLRLINVISPSWVSQGAGPDSAGPTGPHRPDSPCSAPRPPPHVLWL